MYHNHNNWKGEDILLHNFWIFRNPPFVHSFTIIAHSNSFGFKRVILVLRIGAACAPWLAAAAGADAAGRTDPVAVGMKDGSRRGDAAGEEEGLCLRKQEATAPKAPEHLEEN